MTAPGYFVTGTDTGVGKTLVSAALLHRFNRHGLRAAGMKPVASGAYLDACEGVWRNEDAEMLRAHAGVALPDALLNPYLMKEATAPHLAAHTEGVQISLQHIAQCYQQIQQMADVVVVEGAGGFVVPLTEQAASDDLAALLGLPVILVVGIRLGCINHALLTCRAVAARGLTLAGWVANGIDPVETRATDMVESLRRRLAAPLLGCLPWQAGMTPVMAANALDLRLLANRSGYPARVSGAASGKAGVPASYRLR